MGIFQHENYKAALSELISSRPGKGRGELTRLAQALRVNATLVSQVLRGNKDFTHEQAYGVSQHFGFTPFESEYFLLLVQRERAGTAALKKFLSQKIEAIRKESLQVARHLDENRTLTDNERSIFYSSWIYSAVRMFTSLGSGQTIPSVAKRFNLSPVKAGEILHFLAHADLCREKNGTFTLGQQQTYVDFHSPFRLQHLHNWRAKAMLNVDKGKEEDLQFSACVSVSKADFEKIRARLVEMIKETAALVKDSPAEEVACVNLDLFWVRE